MTDENGANFPRQIYDVLIVGAGPVGLATALGLRKRGITNILVIDQTREFRKVGQGVDLLPNGLRAIKYTDSDAYEKIKKSASQVLQPPHNKPSSSSSSEVKEQPAPPKKRWCNKNLQGEITRSFPLDFESWFERYGEGRVSISWFDLQTSLRNLLPSDIVQANHRCVHIEEETGWVRIDSISDTTISNNPFAHWEKMQASVDASTSTQDTQGSDHKSFYAKLVVAADGINSTIRQVLYDHKGLKEWEKPQYSGFAGISSRITHVPTSIIEELDSKYIQGGRITSIYNDSENLDNPDFKLLRVMLIRLPDNTIGYFLISPFCLEFWKNKSQKEILELGIETVKNAEFPPVFTDLIGLSNPEQLSHRPFYIHPVTTHQGSHPSWSHGRVVLVGDAAHGMPPFMAQGANQGLEDAAVIATAISKLIHDNGLEWDSAIAEGRSEAIANAFHQYEQIRKPFMEKVQTATMTCNRWTQQQWDDFNEVLHRREYPSSVTLGEFF